MEERELHSIDFLGALYRGFLGISLLDDVALTGPLESGRPIGVQLDKVTPL
jgi:hypothetical protein